MANITKEEPDTKGAATAEKNSREDPRLITDHSRICRADMSSRKDLRLVVTDHSRACLMSLDSAARFRLTLKVWKA